MVDSDEDNFGIYDLLTLDVVIGALLKKHEETSDKHRTSPYHLDDIGSAESFNMECTLL